MTSFSIFTYVSEDEVNALIQKAIAEKTKIARKFCFSKSFESKKKWIWSIDLTVSLDE